ncbi:MAG TPA: Lrp/AsnC ligand binding domain-containing protein [Candidatus Latescibacteria bacterium]|nr:Lrp/AsnC ligand binding domain-containing protein [Candidatus Latescibacterota bacterium]HOS63476.1 Lrp/AsnC ligand binding domain-containing protein [Candidatus Latescibacterota bacterium]HOT35232.1 Lrp/AsnC ligand binding domain-containing protein [Candidatus Latescibacterota bacterium]HPC44990.1 Lrp/AsnC ligand binding domain-containing protein [Candidatus Latescibacterota bacterium]HPK73225.1 Lrp/AsnC ligand binding domain-containing protein [Candidatus Latescibacterota bacterium]
MLTAIMLINAELKSVAAVTRSLAEIPEVRQLFTTTGQFDVVAVLVVKDSEALAEAVTERIANVPGIVRTSTLLAIRCHAQSLLQSTFSVGFEPAEPSQS